MADQHSQPIKQAVAYIATKLHASITLAEVADHVGLSRFYLSHRFKREVGVTPIQYHMQLRMELAIEMLKGGQTAVSVAKELGFADDAHFSRHFKRHTGQTPGRYSESDDEP